MIRRWLAWFGLLAVPALAQAVIPSAVDSSRPDIPSTTQAPVALVADLSSGQILFARSANRRIHPASMTKAMTALVAFDLVKSGRLDEQAVVTVNQSTAKRWSGKGTSLNLRGGEHVRVGDLLMGTTTVSANDAAVALAEAAGGSVEQFVALMNERAAALGMSGSHFANPNGLPDGARTYVTANDLIRLATALIKEHPDLYGRYFGKKSMIWRGRSAFSHDPFAGVLPGADGIKTGFTKEAGYNFLGAVERGGRRLVVVVAAAPSEAARAGAAKSLAEWGYKAWLSHAFLDPDTEVGAVLVQTGSQRRVPVGVPRAFTLAVPAGAQPSCNGTITYIGPVRAPIRKGQVIGRLEIHQAGAASHVLPLVAMKDVSVAGPIDRIVNALLGLVA